MNTHISHITYHKCTTGVKTYTVCLYIYTCMILVKRVVTRFRCPGWQYVIDLLKQEQLNPKTKKARPICRVEVATSPVSPEGAAAGAACQG